MRFDKLIHLDGWKMDRLISAYVRLGRFSGTALVACGDQVLYRKGYGMASYEHAVPNLPRTVFHIGSLTKPFTAICILQLQERGSISLNEPITRYLPDYPDGASITLHHLLTNTSGIPDYITQQGFAETMALPISLAALIGTFRDQPRMFAPGERFSYSNSNWVLLGAIIEAVSGKTYGQYLRDHVFIPAGMAQSGYDASGIVVNGLASGYVYRDGQMISAATVHPSQMHAAGGIYTTAEDLQRWDRSLHNSTLLSPASRDLMFTPHVQVDRAAYGYGWVVGRAFGRRRVWHDGGMPGFLSIFSRYVDDDSVVIALSNFENAAYTEIERGLAAILFDQ